MRITLPFIILTCATLWYAVGCALVDPPQKTPVREELSAVQITEVHYHPADSGTTDGDEYEFFEIKNTGAVAVDLSDVAFTDGIDFTFPSGSSISAGGFKVLAYNSGAFTTRYGFEPDAVYSGKLANSGESVSLSDLRAATMFITVTYTDLPPWPAEADGDGRSLVPFTADLAENPGDATLWRTSFMAGGSPGGDDPGVVYVNEVFTHTDLPDLDAVEIYNPNSAPADIGGWYLTDRKVDPMKYRIPAGTTVPAGGFLVITEKAFNADPSLPASFRFSEHGEEVWLFSDSTGGRNGSYGHGFAFGEIENGVSFGRIVNSVGAQGVAAQKSVTLGRPNAGPRIGPLVITEIMYHPSNDSDEYVELTNIGDTAVPLYDPRFPANTWKISGTGFSFPSGVTMRPGEVLLVISNAISADQFRSLYGVPSGVAIHQKSADLSNAGDTIQIIKPGEPYVDSSAIALPTVVPYLIRERVIFSDGVQWPADADGAGKSLHRKDPAAYADDPANWKAALPTPGR